MTAAATSFVFEAVDTPCSGPFHFSHMGDHIYDFCPLPDTDVGLSILVCDVEHTSFHFGLCSREFVLYLFGQCPGAVFTSRSYILNTLVPVLTPNIYLATINR